MAEGEADQRTVAGDDFEAALAEVLRNGSKADPTAVLVLVDTMDERVEDELLERFQNPDEKFDVAAVLSQALVARNPDRDPRYLMTHLLSFTQLNPFASKVRRREESALSNPSFGAYALGFSRLRQVDPVGVYERQLANRFMIVRLCAAAGLGDTADLAALGPLSRALEDHSWRVRVNAADSVRRLRHAGAGEVLATHAARDGLIRCLSDWRHRVRVAAARALGSMGILSQCGSGGRVRCGVGGSLAGFCAGRYRRCKRFGRVTTQSSSESLSVWLFGARSGSGLGKQVVIRKRDDSAHEIEAFQINGQLQSGS